MSSRPADPVGAAPDLGERGGPVAAELLGPLPVWTLAAVAGARLGELAPASVPRPVVAVLLGALTTAVLAGIALLRCRPPGPPAAPLPQRWPAVAAVLLVAAISAAGALVRGEAAAAGELVALAASGGRAELTGVVVHEPRPIAGGWHVLLRIDTVDGRPVRERAAVTLEQDPPVLGSRWQLRASARPLPDGGYGRWLARQHAGVVLDPVRWEPVGAPGWWAAASEHVRDRVRTAATAVADPRAGGLVVGFVTGDTRLLSAGDRDAMRATGLTHLTAVSGSNVALLLAGVLGLVSACRVGAAGRRGVVVVTIVWFALVTRFEPSVLRAGTMALLMVLAGARGVPGDARTALAGAVLVLVLLDPLLAGSLGLLLSATATAGVLVVAPRVRARLPSRLPRRVAELASITVGAQLAVVPIVLTSFGELGLASLPANLVAVPAAGVAAALGFVGSAVALVHHGAGSLVLALAAPPARLVLAAAHTFAPWDARIDLARPVTVAAVAVGVVWLLSRPGTARARVALATALALAGAAALPSVAGGRPPAVLQITAIDVGQGDAFLLESPQARILVDAGEDATAARWLRDHGRRRLDLVVVTHPHLDHVGGVPEVLRRLDVGAVWYRPVPTELPEAREVLEVAAARGVPVLAPVAGDRVQVGDLDVEVLHPPPGRPHRAARSELNETSLVLLIGHGDRRVLTTGDVELGGQALLLAAGRDRLRASVLTVPHHGAATTDPAFLAAVAPQHALIGVGADNRHGHPDAATLAVLDQLGATVHRTDRDGTVTVTVPPVGSAHAPVPAPRRRRRPAPAA